MTATYLALQPSGQLLVRPRPANWRESVDAQAFARPPAQRQKAAAVSVVHESHDWKPLLPQKHMKRKHDTTLLSMTQIMTCTMHFRSACASCGKSHTSFVITWFQTRILAMPPRALVAKSSWCVRIMLSDVCFQQHQCGGKIDGGHDTGERTRTKSLTFSRSPFATTWWNAATAFVLPSFLAVFIFEKGPTI